MNVSSTLVEAHIFRKIGNDLEFLLLKRASNEKYADVWQMVTGSIESESAHQTAIREIKEETGLTPIKFWVVPNINSFYSPEQDVIIMIPVFAVLVDKNQKVMISEEHSEYKWVIKEEAIKLLAWPGQRKSVEIIYEYFTNQQSFLKFVEIHL
ncbi:MAG: NUDIX pyrophosphatase [Ignavibacteriales bacterium]|nr:NUDIX pyrophosphatase [Ignavibacteriales bacterium]